MTMRKLAVLGILSLIGVTAFETDAQAQLLRRRRAHDCDCAVPVAAVATSCNTCGATAYVPTPAGSIPLTLPMPGTAADGTIVKADGTIVKPDGTKIKPDGTVIKPDGTVIPAAGTTT